MTRSTIALAADLGPPLSLPLLGTPVRAGFPSPADDFVEGSLDLNAHLVRNAAATFYVRASGASMTGAGIFPGDILVVDRSIEPAHGKIVIAILNGALTVKRLHKRAGQVQLRSENPAYAPITITEGEELLIWGVVTNVVHAL